MFKVNLFCLLLAFIATPASAEQITGFATAIDGDTLKLNDTTIRLFGIDAPEADQTCLRDEEKWLCGKTASEQLAELIETQLVTCDISGLDTYGRSIAICNIGYMEINRTMVEQGWAVAFRKYSAAYVSAETQAKFENRGIWISEFELPEHYRIARQDSVNNKRHKQTPAANISGSKAHDGSCTIKGNRNRRGEWIYHLPGMPYYDVTRPEDIFCTEEAARKAGYRRAIVR